jgi:hypothetical protein
MGLGGLVVYRIKSLVPLDLGVSESCVIVDFFRMIASEYVKNNNYIVLQPGQLMFAVIERFIRRR